MKDWFLWVFYIGEAVNSKAVCKIIDNENNDKAFDKSVVRGWNILRYKDDGDPLILK